MSGIVDRPRAVVPVHGEQQADTDAPLQGFKGGLESEERLQLEGFADEVDQLLYDALDAEIGLAIQTVIDETGADPSLPAVRSTIERALNDYISRNYR